ncbi:hypothetical protein BpHYR1_030607 [Brachionus plicatilis]|uniref:Uncharacterized protein n=1 Tax=Brachionus plicatilis TaxID=10195 RepID=A0A3M7Q413_BRAPC|nr:hypothetical protein BpHYR1_030607 [Brachionus plicatilis]
MILSYENMLKIYFSGYSNREKKQQRFINIEILILKKLPNMNVISSATKIKIVFLQEKSLA